MGTLEAVRGQQESRPHRLCLGYPAERLSISVFLPKTGLNDTHPPASPWELNKATRAKHERSLACGRCRINAPFSLQIITANMLGEKWEGVGLMSPLALSLRSPVYWTRGKSEGMGWKGVPRPFPLFLTFFNEHLLYFKLESVVISKCMWITYIEKCFFSSTTLEIFFELVLECFQPKTAGKAGCEPITSLDSPGHPDLP